MLKNNSNDNTNATEPTDLDLEGAQKPSRARKTDSFLLSLAQKPVRSFQKRIMNLKNLSSASKEAALRAMSKIGQLKTNKKAKQESKNKKGFK